MKKVFIYAVVFFLAVVAGGFVFAQQSLSEASLTEGENVVNFKEQIYARELVSLNPEIEYIYYRDVRFGKQFAFVNVFGGVGQNFLLVPGVDYEISMKKSDTQQKSLVLPEGNSVHVVQ